jgi:hypothetical protein
MIDCREWLRRQLDPLRKAVGGFSLDIAEMLPPFNGGPVQLLQTIRRDNREATSREHVRSRPPAGTAFRYEGCCLFEMFSIEDFEDLERCIKRLFPRTTFFRSSYNQFINSAEEIRSGGWSRLGTLVPAGQRSTPRLSNLAGATLQTEVMPTLPRGVKSVEVTLFRPLPSLFALALYLQFDQEATDALALTQQTKNLPEVRFWPMMPMSARRFASSTTTSGQIAVESILSHLDQVRCAAERCLRPFVKGHFTRRSRNAPRLPAVEVYILTGTGPSGVDFQRWKESARGWWQSMGFEFYPWKCYESSNTVLTLSGFSPSKHEVPYKLFCLADGMSGERQYVTISGFLTSAISILSLWEFVDSICLDVGKARHTVYRTLQRHQILPRLGPDVDLSRQVARHSILIKRAGVEFTHDQNLLNDGAKDLSQVLNDRGDDQTHGLLTDLLQGIERQIGLARDHIDLMINSYSDHLFVRNMALTYRLQWAVLFLTFVAALSAVVTTAANWNEIGPLWSALIARLRAFL